ncbi:hypothetical protein D3C81_1180930 [compost metagenome]
MPIQLSRCLFAELFKKFFFTALLLPLSFSFMKQQPCLKPGLSAFKIKSGCLPQSRSHHLYTAKQRVQFLNPLASQVLCLISTICHSLLHILQFLMYKL